MIVNGFTSKAAAIRHLRAAGFAVAGLLASPESNPKVAKNGKVVDVLTAPLHLAPARLSGFNTCAQASKGCAAACLHTAGNPAYMEGKARSRVTKTQAYFRERRAFMAVLVFEIAAHVRKAAKMGMEPGIRLNATSDIPWEAVGVEINGTKVRNVMEAFPGVSFYDYTKITKRALRCARGEFPANYHLTFSRTEEAHNHVAATDVLMAGGNVAAVFTAKAYRKALAEGVYGGFPVVDGDAHDYRPADGRGVIVALKAKGDARHDTTGFVIA